MSLLVLMLLLISPLFVEGNEIEKLRARVAVIKDKLYILKDNIGSVLKNNAFLEPEKILDSEVVDTYFTGNINIFKINYDLKDAQKNLQTLQAFIDVTEEISKTESSVESLNPIFEQIDSCKVEIILAEKLQGKVKKSLQTLDKYIRFMQSGLKNPIEEMQDKSAVAERKIQDINKTLTTVAHRIGVRIN